jgi:ribonuclease P protein component
VTREPSGTQKRLPNPAEGARPAGGGVFKFPAQARIQRSADFRAVYDNGIRLSGPLFTAFCLSRADEAEAAPAAAHSGGAPDLDKKPVPCREKRESARLGITIPRAVGKSVVRNRIKRRIRELFRLHRSEIAPEWDIVINPRKAAFDATFADLERAFQRVIEKCKIKR